MDRIISIIALALAGIFLACGASHAESLDQGSGLYRQTAALMGPTIADRSIDEQREVITPPSSIDPGMALDPPASGARMPIIHPPGTPGGRLVLPR
jgi:hypothetical protein